MPTAADRPRYRGVLHQYAFFVAVVAGALLIGANRTSAPLPATIFAFSVAGLLGTSALYHRVTWSPTWYPRIRRLDHAMIFVLITGTNTPIFMGPLAGRGLEGLFIATYSVAAAGMAVIVFWPSAPKWVRAGVYLAAGWIALPLLDDFATVLGAGGMAMLLLGGAFYSVGAVIYALKKPDPVPDVFGYHEIFHALVIAALVAHYLMIAVWVL